MTIAGLSFPHLSEADPDLVGEGSLDPLGLAPTADRLAERILPHVTARMSRPRFLTVMAVCAAATDRLEDAPSIDGTPPYLAFEWHLATALARTRGLPKEATRIPGIDKARSVVARGGFLDARSYLKAPSVFGFNGVYKRLAIDLGLISADLSLKARGEQLVRIWEGAEDLEGFAGRRPGSPGATFADQIERWVQKALSEGRVVLKPQTDLWWRLAETLRPDNAGRAEKRQLGDWLTAPVEPLRRETILSLRGIPETDTEAESLRAVRINASPPLARCLDAIDAYERVAELLTAGFTAMRRMSTAARPKQIGVGRAAEHGAVTTVAAQLPTAMAVALECLDHLGLSQEVEENLGHLAEANSPKRFLEALFEHHRTIQANKPPGKRPWFEGDPDRFMVRLPYQTLDEPDLSSNYLHPYRVNAMRSFILDLT